MESFDITPILALILILSIGGLIAYLVFRSSKPSKNKRSESIIDVLDNSDIIDPVALEIVSSTEMTLSFLTNRENRELYETYGPKYFSYFRRLNTNVSQKYAIISGESPTGFELISNPMLYHTFSTRGFLTEDWEKAFYDPNNELYNATWVENLKIKEAEEARKEEERKKQQAARQRRRSSSSRGDGYIHSTYDSGGYDSGGSDGGD